jgi:hypothetical protein
MEDEGTWLERTGVRLRGVGEYLRDHGGTANKNTILESIGSLLEPTEGELVIRSDGQPKWRNDVEWQSTTWSRRGG